MKLSGKPVVLRARDDHRSPVQDGNAGAAADTRLRRMRAGREIPGTADALPGRARSVAVSARFGVRG